MPAPSVARFQYRQVEVPPPPPPLKVANGRQMASKRAAQLVDGDVAFRQPQTNTKTKQNKTKLVVIVLRSVSFQQTMGTANQ